MTKLPLNASVAIVTGLSISGLDLRDYRKSVVDSYSEEARFISGKCSECSRDSLIIPIV